MITRRGFARTLGGASAGVLALTEAALAQRAAVKGDFNLEGMVWLNANENPAGPGPAAIEAMTRVLPDSWRYHYQEFQEFYAAVAQSESLEVDQVLVGAGSSEILHAAIDAFTSPVRPLITIHPTFEIPEYVTRAKGNPVVRVPLNDDYAADVKRLAEEAARARGGLIYLCNPNNPTASITKKADVAWLVPNLPPDTVLLVDEAYIHFGDSPDLESALPYVRQGKDVIVARTFSKIYGMAGLRAGFGCARPDLIRRMEPFRNNVISIVTARAVRAALGEASTLLPKRRAGNAALRADLCAWLKAHNLRYIESHANFVMFGTGTNVRELLPAMFARGVAPGRPFPPYDTMMRVTMGREEEMEKFKRVFLEVYKA